MWKDHLGDTGLCHDDYIKCSSKMGCEGVYWILLSQNRIQCGGGAPVNMAVNLRVL
jgi:hypothetical protein